MVLGFGVVAVFLLAMIAMFLDQIRDELSDIAWLLEKDDGAPPANRRGRRP